MNKKHSLQVFILIVVSIMLSSCSSMKRTYSTVVPQASNTVNSIRFSELNLESKDYTIMKTITSDAKVIYTTNRAGSNIKIKEENGEFSLNYLKSREGSIYLSSFEGVVRVGYLTNDDLKGEPTYYSNPESLARSLAIYRLINVANANGADGVIEPIVSTNVEQIGNDIVFVTTVSAKLVKIKVK